MVDVAPGQTVAEDVLIYRNPSSVGRIALSVGGLRGLLRVSVSPSTIISPRFARATLSITAPPNVLPQLLSGGRLTATPSATAGSTSKSLSFQVLVQAQKAVWVTGLQVTQATQNYDQAGQSDYNGATLIAGKKTVVRAFVDLQGHDAIGDATRPPLSIALYGRTEGGRLLPGSPLLRKWSPSPDSLPSNVPSVSIDQQDSARSAFVFDLPESWTQPGRFINLAGVPVAPQPPPAQAAG